MQMESSLTDVAKQRGVVELLEGVMRPQLAFFQPIPGYGVARVVVRRSPEQMRSSILRYEQAVGMLPQTELPVRHYWIEGRRASHVYAREISIGAGVAAVGRVHKYATINVISKGAVLVASEAGVRRVMAPFTWISQPGAKRALYVLEDLIWTTFHLTDELDEAKMKDDLGFVTYDEFMAWSAAGEGHAQVAA